ncbi:peptidase inhibitor family I36 protein [Actinomadura sp. 9N215]|uniref:peptidase inhibitor family I36 protein n=1 Tax=Actinomadura sp. 9N215 TaxID=3375150 RepID=UPI0037BC5D4B
MRKAATVTIVGMVTMVGAGLSATPANAATGNGVCEAGEFCVYRDTTGNVLWDSGRTDNSYSNDTYPLAGGTVQDTGSSVVNRRGKGVRIFVNGDQNGAGWNVPADGKRWNLSGTPVGNDRASSHQFL